MYFKTFFSKKFLMVVFVIMIAILVMSTKFAAPSLLKIKVLRYTDGEVIISVHDVMNS